MSGATDAASHALEHEARFVDKLGTWSLAGRIAGRKALLTRYAEALKLRYRGLNGRQLLTEHERSVLRQRAVLHLEAA